MAAVIEAAQPPAQSEYRCPECGFVYAEKEWADKCEAWCREHKSCNLEIIQHGRLPGGTEGIGNQNMLGV